MSLKNRACPWATCIMLLSVLMAPLQASAGTLVVSTTADSGPSSLRQAIITANTSSPPAVIHFSIPGTGTQTISLLSPLPELTSPMILDATTQPGYAGAPLVNIDCSSLTNGSGLEVFASSVGISGLGIVNCTNGWGIFGAECTGLVLSNCFCQNDAYSGIELSSCSSSVIYGCTVSSNAETAIAIYDGASNTVQNCVVAANNSGSFALEFFSCASSTVSGCNVSSNSSGMFIYGGGTNTVQNCIVGGNSYHGVSMESETSSSINNCWFGVDASGQKLLSPQEDSVTISGCMGAALAGNVFAGDSIGVVASTATNSMVTNNTFGYLADGATPGHNQTGVQIESGCVNTWVSNCAFGACSFSGVAVGFTGDPAPYAQGTMVNSCVFGATAATGFPYLNHEFNGGALPTNALAGPGCTAPAIHDYNGINTVCNNNLSYQDSSASYQSASGVNTIFQGCLCVGSASGVCISTADNVPAPLVTQAPYTNSTLTPTVSLSGALPNANYTVWMGKNLTGDNQVQHYLGQTSLLTDGTGYGAATMVINRTVPTNALVYAYAIAPGGGTSLRSFGTGLNSAPQLGLTASYLPGSLTSGDSPWTFSTTVHNSGLAPAANVLVTVGPDPNLAITGGSSSQGVVSTVNNGLLWQFPALGPGTSASLQVTYQACYVSAGTTIDVPIVAAANNAPWVSASWEVPLNPLNLAALETYGSPGSLLVGIPYSFAGLQYATHLTGPWQTVPSTNGVQVGSNFVYTFSPSNVLGFFRLSAPTPPAPAPYEIYQVALALDDAPPVLASGIGMLLLNQVPPGPTNFVNLVAGPPGTNALTTNNWVIRNYPVNTLTNVITNYFQFSTNTFRYIPTTNYGYDKLFFEGLSDYFSTNYSTNLYVITNLPRIRVDITTNRITTPNLSNTTPTRPNPYPVIFKHGVITNAFPWETNVMQVYNFFSVVATALAQAGFPNQEQGTNECVPGAIGNSLNYLNGQFQLGLASSNLTIAALKPAVQWTSGGAPTNWPALKAQYMASNNFPIVTTNTTNVAVAMTALNATNDVELYMAGHVACVLRITQFSDGIYGLDIAHDIRQGQPGGTVVQAVTYDPTTGLISGLPWGSSPFVEFVIEHPPP